MANFNIKKLAAGFVLATILIPSFAFAATPTTTTNTAYIAELKQLLALLEQELAALLATSATPATTTVPAATQSTVVTTTTTAASTTIAVAFTVEPEYVAITGATTAGNTYEHLNEIKLAVTPSGHNVYIPISNGIVYYVSPASPAPAVTETVQCDTGSSSATAGGLQYCLVQAGTTGDIDISWNYNALSSGTTNYAFGISAIQYTDNTANTSLDSYVPQGTVVTKPQ